MEPRLIGNIDFPLDQSFDFKPEVNPIEERGRLFESDEQIQITIRIRLPPRHRPEDSRIDSVMLSEDRNQLITMSAYDLLLPQPGSLDLAAFKLGLVPKSRLTSRADLDGRTLGYPCVSTSIAAEDRQGDRSDDRHVEGMARGEIKVTSEVNSCERNFRTGPGSGSCVQRDRTRIRGTLPSKETRYV